MWTIGKRLKAILDNKLHLLSSFVRPTLQLASHFMRQPREEANAEWEPILIRHQREEGGLQDEWNQLFT